MVRPSSPSADRASKRDLYTLITTFASAKASHEYDRISALLGIANDSDGATSLVASYTATVTEAILGTLRHMVKSDESVDPSMPFHTIESFISDLCSSRHPELLE